MSGLFAFLFLVAIVATVVFFIKSGRDKKKGDDNTKNKRLAFISLALVLVFFILTGVTAPKTESDDNNTQVQKDESVATTTEQDSNEVAKSEVEEKTDDSIETEEVSSDDSSTEETTSTEELREAFNSSLGETKPTWYSSVRNDSTGNWRELVIYSDKAIDEQLAIDYCNAYVESDSEVHFIVNLYLKTTTRISKMGNLIFVTVHEYVDGEEHDAKILPGGDVLDDFCVDIETGKKVE